VIRTRDETTKILQIELFSSYRGKLKFIVQKQNSNDARRAASGAEDKRRSKKSAHTLLFTRLNITDAHYIVCYFLLLKAFYNSRLFSSHSTIDQFLTAIIIYDYIYAIVESVL